MKRKTEEKVDRKIERRIVREYVIDWSNTGLYRKEESTGNKGEKDNVIQS